MPTAERQRPVDAATEWRHSSRESVRTHFLRVPRLDWAMLMTGEKREFRVRRGHQPAQLQTPVPVVIYSLASYGGSDMRQALMVCEDQWDEPLSAMNDDSIAAEGYKTLAEFRLYWGMRHRKDTRDVRATHEPAKFNPFEKVIAYRLRPWRGEQDEIDMGRELIRRLYLEPVENGPET